jgi:thioredoxin 1
MNDQNGKSLHINDAEFEQAIQSTSLVLVDFFAPWCGPCRTMGPIIDELAGVYEGKVGIYKMNIDDNSQSPNQYKVLSIPTIILFKDGVNVERWVGVVSKAMLQEKIDFYLA